MDGCGDGNDEADGGLLGRPVGTKLGNVDGDWDGSTLGSSRSQ